jgi:hypothetical protein
MHALKGRRRRLQESQRVPPAVLCAGMYCAAVACARARHGAIRVGGSLPQLVELYGRFIGSTNFRGWFTLHRQRLAVSMHSESL